LCGFVRGLIGNAEQARDITQDVFMVAWRAAKEGSPPFTANGDERSIRRWLYCVAYRRAISIQRHERVLSIESLDRVARRIESGWLRRTPLTSASPSAMP
jgi:DNA-directed RNA polymerase specialized sigma24 family protein